MLIIYYISIKITSDKIFPNYNNIYNIKIYNNYEIKQKHRSKKNNIHFFIYL